MRGAEEEDAIGAGVDGLEMRDFGCCSAHGVCKCLLYATLSKMEAHRTSNLNMDLESYSPF